jgi:hypothetical protein
MAFAKKAALLAEYGIPVMPVEPRDKKTVLKDWPQRATTDPVQIAEWDKENPNYNSGAVGREKGFWIFDADRFISLSGQIERETKHHLDSIDTLRVQSSEGKMHLYFKHNARSESLGNFSVDDEKGEIFSVRARNAYVVGPGSIHPQTGLAYEIIAKPTFGDIPVAPDWLMDWLEKSKRFSTKQKAKIASDDEAQIPEGGRDEFLFAEACKLRDAKVSAKVALVALKAINTNRCVPPMAESDIAIKIKSAYTRESRVKPVTDAPCDAAVVRGLTFHQPPVQSNPKNREYVISPASNQKAGWFMRGGAASILCGASGTSKTTWAYQMLVAQKSAVPFYGHETYGRAFITMGVDRGEADYLETMERMHKSPDSIPFKPLSTVAFDLDAVQAIIDAVESTVPLPEVVFVEGVDMMISKNDTPGASLFMHGIQTIAERYNLAFILSTGSAKTKEGQGYKTTRDNVIGSTGWGRCAGAIVSMLFPKNDDSSGKRKLTVMLRNAPAEKFNLAFVDGLLELDPDSPSEAGEDANDKYARELEWYQNQPSKKWWTAGDVERALGLSESTARRHVQEACTKGYITRKPGKRKSGRGMAAEYRWNAAKTNPMYVEPEPSEDLLTL